MKDVWGSGQVTLIVSLFSLVSGFALNQAASRLGINWVLIIVVLLVLLFALLILYLERFRRISDRLSGENPYSVDWTPNFKRTGEILSGARKSVYVVTSIGDRFEHLSADRTRGGYLDLMTSVIDSNKNNPAFNYYRVMPARRYAEIVSGEYPISDYDPQVAFHLESVRTYLKNNSDHAVVQQIEFYMSGLIPLCPSILVIDEEYICFALPEKRRNVEILEDDSMFQLKGVLIIQDRSGETPREMIKIIRTFGEGQFNLLANGDGRVS